MRIRSNESGMGSMGAMFLLVLLGIGFYIAVKIIPVFVDHERMKDTMRTKASVAQVLKDEEILRDLAAKARELDLPLKQENFLVLRDMEQRKMTIKTAWEVEVHFFGDLYVHTYRFAPVAEENIMSR